MNLLINKAKIDDFDFIKSLWVQAFDKDFSKAYLDFAYKNLLKIEYTHIIFLDKKPVGMGLILPACINNEKCFYLYSLAVDENFRNRGIMEFFLKYASDYSRHNNVDKLFLVPQNKYLRTYYKKHGYADCSWFYEKNLVLNKNAKTILFDNLDKHKYSLERQSFFSKIPFLKLDSDYHYLSIKEGDFFNQSIVKCDFGMVVFENLDEDSDEIIIKEMLVEPHNINDVAQSLMLFLGKNKAIILQHTNKASQKSIPYAMMKSNNNILINNIYANFLLD